MDTPSKDRKPEEGKTASPPPKDGFDPTTVKNYTERKRMLKEVAGPMGREIADEMRPLDKQPTPTCDKPWESDSWPGKFRPLEDDEKQPAADIAGFVDDGDDEEEAGDPIPADEFLREEEQEREEAGQFLDTGKSFRPKQYRSQTGQDVIDVAEDFGILDDAFRFNILKYLLRAGKKYGESMLDDATKILDYAQRWNQYLRGESRVARQVKLMEEREAEYGEADEEG